MRGNLNMILRLIQVTREMNIYKTILRSNTIKAWDRWILRSIYEWKGDKTGMIRAGRLQWADNLERIGNEKVEEIEKGG